jgi:hypothetical protein
MAREKGKLRKEKKILIRVNKVEKEHAEKQSKTHGENTSQYFRRLLREDAEGSRLEKITNRLEQAATRISSLVWKTKS